jgi:hypothetical protein
MAHTTQPGPDELWPVKAGHGPKLRLADGRLRVRISTTDDDYPVGDGANQAAAFARYTSTITANSRDALTMRGRHVTGWLLLDGNGAALARLASDDEVVYDPRRVAAFAARAHMRVDDWGEVPDARIDGLLATHRGGLPPRALGATRREWIMFAAVIGGFLVAWPFESQITYDSTRTQSLVLLALGVSGFLVGALGLWLGRLASHLPDRPVMVAGLALAVVLAVGSVVGSTTGQQFWRLSPAQSATVVLGCAVICAVLPFWARVQRLGIRATP